METYKIDLENLENKTIEEEVSFKYLSLIDGELVESPDGKYMSREDAEKAMNWAMQAITVVEQEKAQMTSIISQQQELLKRMNSALEEKESVGQANKGIIYAGRVIGSNGDLGN